MLRQSVVDEIGYMDEDFFIYYSDTDWSFRARLCGYDVVAAPRAVVYHKFSATVGAMASTFKLGLVTVSRLRFAWKNLDFRRACKLAWLFFKGDLGGFLWARHLGMDEAAATYARSRLQWVGSWPKVVAARMRTRSLRRPPYSDDAVFALTEDIPRPAMWGAYPVISAPLIRSHYMRLGIFSPGTPPSAADLAPPGPPAPPPLPVLAQRSWQAFSEKGLRGLVDGVRDYFLWRIQPK
jgi:hypothetical protein